MKIARRESESETTANAQHRNVLGVAMSVPRLAFMDNSFCMTQLVQAFDFPVPVWKHTGAYWGQCLTRAIKELIVKFDPALIMTMDYDTVFRPETAIALINILKENPSIDAIAPVQMHRTEPRPLFSVKDAAGHFVTEVPDDYFVGETSRIHTAHMGAMVFRVDSLMKIKKPWFWSQPGPDGDWDAGHIDDDTWFWERWAEAGNTLHLANRHSVGHAELMVRWPSGDFGHIDRHPSEFWAKGAPEGVWK
jgi:hypothetical protein